MLINDFMAGVGELGVAAVHARVSQTAKDVGVRQIMPTLSRRLVGTAPNNPNVFCDGSLKNTKGYFWQVGGAGVWWPDRAIATISEEEKEISEFEEHEVAGDIFAEGGGTSQKGIMPWCPFNSRLNSSTRCELGAAPPR